MTYRDDKWWMPECYMLQSLGYGTYTVRLDSPVNDLNPSSVFSPFVYENLSREMDIEFSKALATPLNAQYVVQPYDHAGNRVKFTMTDAPQSTHRLVWHADHLDFSSWSGWADAPTPATLIYEWTYTGDDIPPPGGERAHFNLWSVGGAAPADGIGDEVIVKSFNWTP
jgi:hypothetical protein